MKEKLISIVIIIISFIASIFIYEYFSKPSVITNYEEGIFDTFRVHKIEIELADKDLNDLRSNPLLKNKYKANVIIDGESFNDVSFATKGEFTLEAAVKANSSRYSYKINFGKYNKEQSYYGLDKINLNNVYSDYTYMKDYISYFIMRNNGVYAPLCSYANLYINGEEAGLYSIVEEVEDSFISRNEISSDSILYKPENNNKDHILLGSDLLYRGRDTNNYIDIFDNAQSKIDEDDEERVIDAIEALSSNDLDKINEYWDMDSVINYFAVNNYLLNFDSYIGINSKNYFLLENDKFTILPWDYNMSFGAFSDKGFGTVSNTLIINYPIDTPLYNVDIDDRPLWRVVHDFYLDKYHERIKEVISKSSLYKSEIKRVFTLIKKSVKKDCTSFTDYESFAYAINVLKSTIDYRTESIRGQLNGSIPSTSEGQEKEFAKLVRVKDINIYDMGK